MRDALPYSWRAKLKRSLSATKARCRTLKISVKRKKLGLPVDGRPGVTTSLAPPALGTPLRRAAEPLTEHSEGLLLRQTFSSCLKAIPLSAEECEPEAAKDQHHKAGTDCQQRQH
jgi:hypothetical protein